MEALEKHGVPGAIVFKGIDGFGAHRRVSSARVVDGLIDMPMLIEVVDEDDRIATFLPQLDTLLADGLVTLERLQAT